jgi:hypothetical protein
MKKKHLIALLTATLTMVACQESLNEKCARECRQYTQKNCPAQIDNHTIIDSMTFEAATRTIHYYYTLTGVADSVGLLSHEEVHQALRDQVRNTTMMRAYKEEGYNFTYTYHSQRRPELVLFEETLTKKDYQ